MTRLSNQTKELADEEAGVLVVDEVAEEVEVVASQEVLESEVAQDLALADPRLREERDLAAGAEPGVLDEDSQEQGEE